jgi:hypothetical protein
MITTRGEEKEDRRKKREEIRIAEKRRDVSLRNETLEAVAGRRGREGGGGGVVPAGFIEEVGSKEGVETIVCEARAIFD